jgi:hypothetical protein
MSAAVPPLLDHLVFGGPDLAAAVAFVAELTGVEAAPGGRHLGNGTANHLIGLGGSAYLEIIGPDPLAGPPPGRRWFGLDDLTAPRLLTWAIRPSDLDATAASARSAGYDPGSVTAMSRHTDDGTDLTWRLTPDTVAETGGLVPFLIDWGTTSHPSTRPLPRLELMALDGTHPVPDQVRPALEALAADLRLSQGSPGLRAVLSGPLGEVVLV